MLHPLSTRQEAVFKAVLSFISAKDYPPTIAEIQKDLSINNPGSVHKALRALENKGYLVRQERKRRGIRLSDSAEERFLQ